MKRPTGPPPLADPPVVLLDAARPLEVTPEIQAAWDKTLKSFSDPKVKTAFAINFAEYTLIRLNHLIRNTTSPKVIQDVARIAQNYVEFAFRESK